MSGGYLKTGERPRLNITIPDRLRIQLQRYADKYCEGNLSQAGRRAIERGLEALEPTATTKDKRPPR